MNWALAVFWKESPLDPTQWLQSLVKAAEADGTRILEYHLKPPNVGQFLLSTEPQVTPAAAIRTIKGRLQHLIRDQHPKAFRRNYSMHSVGSANCDAIERYLATQHTHHPMADRAVQDRLVGASFSDPKVDLCDIRRSAYGEFVYNLQLVLVRCERGIEIRQEQVDKLNHTIRRIAHKKNHLLSQFAVLADHIHVTIGCDITHAPSEIALAYMNNLAYAHGMKRIFEHGYYVGSFGRYDLQAIRHSIEASSRRGKPDGDG